MAAAPYSRSRFAVVAIFFPSLARSPKPVVWFTDFHKHSSPLVACRGVDNLFKVNFQFQRLNNQSMILARRFFSVFPPVAHPETPRRQAFFSSTVFHSEPEQNTRMKIISEALHNSGGCRVRERSGTTDGESRRIYTHRSMYANTAAARADSNDKRGVPFRQKLTQKKNPSQPG